MKQLLYSLLCFASICLLNGCQIGSTTTTTNPSSSFNFSYGITSLYPFAGGSGQFVEAPLMQANNGDLYGTSISGGENGLGTIFKISLTGTKTLIYSFYQNPTDGYSPRSSLIQLSDNYLYGTTTFGGSYTACESNGCGTIYKISLTGQNEQIIYAFESRQTGNSPLGGLTYNPQDDFLYGTTSAGGNNCGNIGCGIIYKIKPNGSNFTTIYLFNGGSSDGARPTGNLLLASDGNLYGITTQGGASDSGTIFKVTPGGNVSLIYSFESGTDGAYPGAGLMQTTDGNLYGTTNYGGYANAGVIYKLNLNNNTETVVKTFESGADGANPNSTLVQARNGLIYGTTIQGGMPTIGTPNSGTIFAFSTEGTYYQVLVEFNLNNGAYPYAGLIQASNNLFYGTSSQGSTYSKGNLFVFNPLGN
jgi:uncharacterized repeat protein (TIGR03803 family)